MWASMRDCGRRRCGGCAWLCVQALPVGYMVEDAWEARQCVMANKKVQEFCDDVAMLLADRELNAK